MAKESQTLDHTVCSEGDAALVTVWSGKEQSIVHGVTKCRGGPGKRKQRWGGVGRWSSGRMRRHHLIRRHHAVCAGQTSPFCTCDELAISTCLQLATIRQFLSTPFLGWSLRRRPSILSRIPSRALSSMPITLRRGIAATAGRLLPPRFPAPRLPHRSDRSPLPLPPPPPEPPWRRVAPSAASPTTRRASTMASRR